MPLYVISYDLRKQRNYEPLLKQLRDWGCARILESTWLGSLTPSSTAVRDSLKWLIDADDGLAVIEIANRGDWATLRCQQAGVDWLKANANG